MGKTRHCYIIYGPTASGKSALAELVAEYSPISIINADSKQVVREIPILTAQPDQNTQRSYPHALYGHVSLTEPYTVREWLADIRRTFAVCEDKGLIPCCVGGTGMFAQALMQGISPVPALSAALENDIRHYVDRVGAATAHTALSAIDPTSAARLAPNDAPRIAKALSVYEATGETLTIWRTRPNIAVLPQEYKVSAFTLGRQREILYDNALRRFDMMLKNGVLEEVRACLPLLKDGMFAASKAHGLPELSAYLCGDMPLEEAKRLSVRNTRHYIKRQFTWMRHRMQEATCLAAHDDIKDSAIILNTIEKDNASN